MRVFPFPPARGEKPLARLDGYHPRNAWACAPALYGEPATFRFAPWKSSAIIQRASAVDLRTKTNYGRNCSIASRPYQPWDVFSSHVDGVIRSGIAEFNCGNPLIGCIKFRLRRAAESAPSMGLNLLIFLRVLTRE